MPLPPLVVGLAVGLRHAFEPDHLAMMTTLASRATGRSYAARLGLAWGVGHTWSVAVVATALIVMGIHVPAPFYRAAEIGVAALLVFFGLGTLCIEARRHRAAHGQPHASAHANRATHAHPHALVARTPWSAFGFGLAHGLAGSGAVVVLLVAASSRVADQISYLAAFGVGTILGMSLVSWLTIAIAARLSRRSAVAATWMRVGSASVSVAIGAMFGAQVLRQY